jgi:hypothetical protein
MLSQKQTHDKLDFMNIHLHRNHLQLPVWRQYLLPAPSPSQLQQMLQLKHLHCLLHKIMPIPTVQAHWPHNVPATVELTSVKQTAAKQANRKLTSDRTSRLHRNGTLTE